MRPVRLESPWCAVGAVAPSLGEGRLSRDLAGRAASFQQLWRQLGGDCIGMAPHSSLFSVPIYIGRG